MSYKKEYRCLDTDPLLSENSDFLVASQKAIKSYVDNLWGSCVTWNLQTYVVEADSTELIITLKNICKDVKNLFAFTNGILSIPTDCLSLENQTTLKIVSEDVFKKDDFIVLRWTYPTSFGTSNDFIIIPEGKKQEDVDYVVEHGTIDGIWYRLYKSGFLEQGGVQEGTSTYGTSLINLPKEFKDINYTVTAQTNMSMSEDWYTLETNVLTSVGLTDICGIPCDKTTTSFKLQSYSTHTWVARGFSK